MYIKAFLKNYYPFIIVVLAVMIIFWLVFFTNHCEIVAGSINNTG
jgi:uncharacterized membrane protein